jgi:hypothetical protein
MRCGTAPAPTDRTLQPIYPVLLQGLIKALQEAGSTLPLDSYWMPVGGPQILAVLTAKSAAQVREAEATARTLGMRLQTFEARNPQEIDRAFAAMTREGPAALVVLTDSIFTNQRGQIAERASKGRLPAVFGNSEHVVAGGLIGYSASFLDLERRAATFVDKILKGAKPGDLPIEQPTKFELVINLKTASLASRTPSSAARRGSGRRGGRCSGRRGRLMRRTV